MPGAWGFAGKNALLLAVALPVMPSFFREAELKHGCITMLAALGYPLAEAFHPLFGGNIAVPSLIAFQQSPLEI